MGEACASIEGSQSRIPATKEFRNGGKGEIGSGGVEEGNEKWGSRTGEKTWDLTGSARRHKIDEHHGFGTKRRSRRRIRGKSTSRG